jgi:(5-formylfuran-3-yl)methyl phosphate synthase
MQLLVSVRSADEAEAALKGGAGLIDVKEPRSGSLGRATDKTISAVLLQVAQRLPVSAAMGELTEEHNLPFSHGLSFIKWGLAGCRSRTWKKELLNSGNLLQCLHPACKPVAVAYADSKKADAPEPEEVRDFALENKWDVLLLDTFEKNGKTLLDWVTLSRLTQICNSCREAGTEIALAGSLGVEHLPILSELQPSWFAVRGAACHRGCREGNIDPGAVRRFVKALGVLAPIAESSPTVD